MNKAATQPSCTEYLDQPIPVVPAGVSYLLDCLNNDELDTAELTAELEKFPSIASRLLAVANSAWSAPQKEIYDLRTACVRLGFRMVRNLSLALAVGNIFDPHKCQSFDRHRYWMSALLSAEAAQRLAEAKAPAALVGAWRAAALMHNIGLLWLADRNPVELEGLLSQQESGSLFQQMREHMSTDYCTAGACLARVWGLPDLFVTVLGNHHAWKHYQGEHEQAVIAVGIAAHIGSGLAQADDAAEFSPCLDAHPEYGDLAQLVEELAAHRGQLGEVAHAIASAA